MMRTGAGKGTPASAESTPVRRARHRLRRLVISGLTTGAVVLLASPAPAAQVFRQFDVIVRSHIHETPAGDDRVVTRPATAKIRINDLSRKLADQEIQDLEAHVPDPLNELCVSSKDGECATTEMEASLEQRASGLLAQLPDLEFGEVSVHIAARRDGEAGMGLLASVLLGFALLFSRRGRGLVDAARRSLRP